ncbi:MAG: alpha/beta hydrolase [Sporichthyaceae bacterium]|nr:alpha/beta hydrolase [Sporichthyaceae bacterium]
MGDSRDVLRRPARPPDDTLAYGPDPAHLVDVRLPATGPAPLLVVLHGGFWMAEHDRAHAAAQSAGLADAGYVVATVEYRRVGMRGGGWPGTFDDVALLSDTVPPLVRAAVGAGVDPVCTVLVGHSAGGHLAAWAAARHRLPEASPWRRRSPLPVAGVVSLAGVLDLVDARRRGLGGHAVRRLLPGRGRGLTERLGLTSPAGLLPIGVPLVLVHGTRDEEVPVDMSRAYAGTAAALGDDVTLHALDGVDHYELIDPLSSAWPTVLAAVAVLTRPADSPGES